MRRRVQQILCGALIAGTVLASQPLPVFAETDTETVVDTSEEEVKADADYEIKVNEDNPNTATLVSCYSDATELKIPEYIDGKKITEIGEWAFKDCKNVTSLELPDSVEVLGSDLFDNAFTYGNGAGKNLAILKLPAKEIKIVRTKLVNEKQISARAQTDHEFAGTYRYMNNMGELDNGPFTGCANLRVVEIPKGWTKVPAYLFDHCSGLESVEIPDTVTELENKAFSNCKIASVTIPRSVKKIASGSFVRCPLKSVSGYKGSYSEKWANKNGYRFVSIEEDGSAIVFGRNLSLGGKIGANVYVQVPKELLEDEKAYAILAVGDREEKEYLKNVPSTEIEGKTTLIFKIDVKACETNDDICIYLFSADGRMISITDEKGKKVDDGYTFTVAETARSHANAKSSSKQLKKLADAILNYGIYTQKLQNYKADELTATDDLSNIKKSSLKNYEVKKNGKVSGVSYAGFNLELKEDTGLAVYFKTTADPGKLAITVDGKKMDVETEDLDGVKLVSVKINGISAQKLSSEREVIVSDGESEMSVKLSALSWSRNVLYGKNYSKETVDLAKMLYRYSFAADAYFEK